MQTHKDPPWLAKIGVFVLFLIESKEDDIMSFFSFSLLVGP